MIFRPKPSIYSQLSKKDVFFKFDPKAPFRGPKIAKTRKKLHFFSFSIFLSRKRETTPLILFNFSCEKKFKRVHCFYRRKGNFDSEFPIKMLFLRIFEIFGESSPIADSIENFTLKNFNSEHF